ncbi:MAG: hypothetical protein KA759_09220, partial [Zoogloea sp.]|nr:hypothetical protein [Zoogloea sp.]
MDHQVKQLLHFGLEVQGLRGGLLDGHETDSKETKDSHPYGYAQHRLKSPPSRNSLVADFHHFDLAQPGRAGKADH